MRVDEQIVLKELAALEREKQAMLDNYTDTRDRLLEAKRKRESVQGEIELLSVGMRGISENTFKRDWAVERDPFLLEERLLELQILADDVFEAVGDSASEERAYRKKAEESKNKLDRMREYIAALPPAVVASVEEVRLTLQSVRKEEGEMASKLDDMKRSIRREELEHKREKEDLTITLEDLSETLSKARLDLRYWQEQYESQEAMLEPLLIEKFRLQKKLESIKGLDTVLQIAFNRFDADASGSLSMKEIERALEAVLGEGKFTPDDVEMFFMQNDTNHDNKIDFQEFKNAYLYLLKL